LDNEVNINNAIKVISVNWRNIRHSLSGLSKLIRSTKTNQIVALAEVCLLTRYRGNANQQRGRVRAYVWLLWNTSE
jgi:hypothetical protein